MITAIDSSFLKECIGQSVEDISWPCTVVEIANDLKCGEGPAWLNDHGLWIFSDIPANRMLAYDARNGLRSFREPSEFSNGNFARKDGGFLTCEHLTRRLTRTLRTGSIEVVCDQYESKRLNSPNDVIEDSLGNVWFTDPTYGIISDEEGKKADPEQARNRVYSVDRWTGDVTAQIDALSMPNGLCLSPDERHLFVGDSGAEQGPELGYDPDGPRSVYKYALTQSGDIKGQGREFCRVAEGVPDGVRCDQEGNLWVATGAGIECFDGNGNSIGVIATPDTATNLCFGGENNQSLLLTTTKSAYLIGSQ